jgi:DNA-binding GntR family transcriptional regulator
MLPQMEELTRIESASVVALAYDQIRALILNGEMEPGDRLGQVELAERLGISRTPVREALRRLTGEGIVSARPNHGFRVADLGLEAVMRRLELRLLLEPGIARLAADRATPADIAALRESIEIEAAATDAAAAHDASRRFHIDLARAAHNQDLVSTIEQQWIVEVGRRLLAARAEAPDWLESDVREHREITDAIEGRDPDLAERLTREHVAAALRHWRSQMPEKRADAASGAAA